MPFMISPQAMGLIVLGVMICLLAGFSHQHPAWLEGNLLMLSCTTLTVCQLYWIYLLYTTRFPEGVSVLQITPAHALLPRMLWGGWVAVLATLLVGIRLWWPSAELSLRQRVALSLAVLILLAGWAVIINSPAAVQEMMDQQSNVD